MPLIHLKLTSLQKFVLALATVVISASVVLVLYGRSRPLKQTFHGTLLHQLPSAPSGWSRTLRPIADSTEMQRAVGEILNYDDAILAEYIQGSCRVSVYAAYWAPGRMSYRLVAGHTPDVCWVGAGWKCLERGTKHAKPMTRSSDLALRFPLPIAESRVYAIRDHKEHVWFWHIVGGVPMSYGVGAGPPWYSFLTDMVAKGLDQREEQFFIRLSSPEPLDNPELALVVDEVLKALLIAPKKNI